jgi:hypothetical protein
VQTLASVDVPELDCSVVGAAHDLVFVELQATNRMRVSRCGVGETEVTQPDQQDDAGKPSKEAQRTAGASWCTRRFASPTRG